MNAKIKIITAMATFGTIGIFVRYIPLPSSIIALVRGVLATFFLLSVIDDNVFDLWHTLHLISNIIS